MKQTIFLLSLFLLFSAVEIQAQSTNSGILYTYDASGNRIKRELAPDIVGRKANNEQNGSTSNTKGDDARDKENKNQAIASANQIQATFTPNPTTTGNFTIFVQKSEKAISTINPNTQTQEVNNNIAYVSVFNALGELIQYKTTQYDKPLNIDLSAFSKGVYLVKVQVLSSVEGQNGEDVILHRMAYQ